MASAERSITGVGALRRRLNGSYAKLDMLTHPAAPIRLLIAEASENRAHELDSMLRDAGILARSEFLTDLESLTRLGADCEQDLLIWPSDFGDLNDLLPNLKKTTPDLPIIVLQRSQAQLSASDGMALGATDVVDENDREHLLLVVRRELENIAQRQKLAQIQRDLNEAEARCELLMSTSDAAIAYVHEGMHIHANDGYFKLFGFVDSDDMLGLPLMDLVTPDGADDLKSRLNTFRAGGDEMQFTFSGQSSDHTPVVGQMTLEAAEYEGEECVMVTIRADGAQPSQPEPQPATDVAGAVAESPEAPAPVPEALEPHVIENDAVAYVEEGIHIFANDTYLELFAIADSDEIVGLPLMDLMAPDAAADLKSKFKAFRAAGEKLQFPFTGQSSDNSPIVGEMALETAEYEGEACMLVTISAGAKRTQPEPSKPSYSAVHANGAASGLEAFVTEVSAKDISAEGQRWAIAVIQIDDFDEMQIEFGINRADEAATLIGEEIRSQLAEGAYAQIAHHRFAAAWAFDNESANHIHAEHIRARVEAQNIKVFRKAQRTTVSIGVTTLTPNQAVDAATDLALRTLLAVDDSEGNHVFQDSTTATGDEPLGREGRQILELIEKAIADHSFVLLFQPIISLRGDSDEHYEVFLRLPDGDGAQLRPGDFLRLAIEHGVAAKIDRWVILQSIKLLSVHRSNGHSTRLTINLTANSICDQEFIEWLAVAIKAARLPSDAVIFQITEQDASDHIDETLSFLEGLKSLHCQSSLGRFGLIEKPFELLASLAVDFVKFDGSLVLALNENPSTPAHQDDAATPSLTDMIKQLQSDGKLTIVPMVEGAAVLSTLWQAGANYIQGHYLQAPSPNMDYDFSTEDDA